MLKSDMLLNGATQVKFNSSNAADYIKKLNNI